MFRSLGRCFPPNLSAHIPPPIIISTSVHWWLKMIQIPGFTSPIVRISSLKCIFCLQRRSGWPKFFSLMTEVFLFFGEDNWARDPTIQSSTVRGPICFDFFFSLFLTNITLGHWFQHYVWSEAWSLGVLYQSVLKESLYTLQHCVSNMHPQMWQLPLLLNYHPAPPSGDLI